MEYSAAMTFRKPQLVPLLFIACSTLLLCGLGLWQLDRLAWKHAALAQAAAAEGQPALGTLPQDTAGLDYRRVALAGTFNYDRQLRLIGPQRGHEVGYFLLAPFTLEDDGRILLVNRGFSPDGKDARPQGPQIVQGIVRPPRAHRLFAPQNLPEKNIWFHEDIEAMRRATGLALTPVIVEATGTAQDGVFPVPGEGRVIMRNDHLQYAITWFSLAFVGIFMFVAYHRKP